MKRLLHRAGWQGRVPRLRRRRLAEAVADLASVWGFHSGQICTAPTRAIVHRSVYDELVAKLAAAAPDAAGRRADRAPRRSSGRSSPPPSGNGSRVTSAADGPKAPSWSGGATSGPQFDTGFYVAPTLIAGATNEMTAAREEIFGPVIVVIPFDDDDEGIAIANDSDYGLYDYVYSEDTARAYRGGQAAPGRPRGHQHRPAQPRGAVRRVQDERCRARRRRLRAATPTPSCRASSGRVEGDRLRQGAGR